MLAPQGQRKRVPGLRFAELGTPDQMLFKIKQIRGLPGGSSLPLYDNDQCRILIRVFAMFTVTFKLKGGGRFRAA